MPVLGRVAAQYRSFPTGRCYRTGPSTACTRTRHGTHAAGPFGEENRRGKNASKPGVVHAADRCRTADRHGAAGGTRAAPWHRGGPRPLCRPVTPRRYPELMASAPGRSRRPSADRGRQVRSGAAHRPRLGPSGSTGQTAHSREAQRRPSGVVVSGVSPMSPAHRPPCRPLHAALQPDRPKNQLALEREPSVFAARRRRRARIVYFRLTAEEECRDSADHRTPSSEEPPPVSSDRPTERPPAASDGARTVAGRAVADTVTAFGDRSPVAPWRTR